MKTTEQRINNIIGQLEGIKRMLTNAPEDCFPLLNQMKAVRSAMSSLTEQLLNSELDRCLNGKISPLKREKMAGLIKEVIKK